MQQIENPEKDFPSIRVFGTIGWIAAGLFIGYGNISFSAEEMFGGFNEKSSVTFLIAAAISVVLGLLSFTLPKTAPKDKGGKVDVKTVLGLDAIGLLKKKSFGMLIGAIFLMYVPMTFYFQFGSPFLTDVGFDKTAALQVIGQVSEVGFMLILPFILAKTGIKPMLIIGMCGWILRYVFYGFADGDANAWMVFGAIGLHGICYDFLFVSTQIYVDKMAPKHLRGSAQALMTTATYGVGMFIGAKIAGSLGHNMTTATGEHDWNSIWLMAAGMVAVILVIFIPLFKDDTRGQKEESIDQAFAEKEREQ
jgi:nucleoside transporter